MALNDRELVVRVVGGSSGLDRTFKQASRSADKFGKDINASGRGAIAASGAFSKLGRSIAFASGGFLAGAGITATIKSTVSAASDLEQQVSKTDVVFGRSAAGVEAWSKTLVNSFGLSRREALAFASGFGALFAPMGIVGDQAAEQSQRLTELGADLASFYNTDVASALDAVRSGIVGESEPLRRYGVQLSEVRVEQEALRQTGKTHAADLAVQEKTLARIAIIWGGTAKAQGDFGRTSETAANQLKIFNAQMENFKATIGTGVLPALTRLLTFINKMGPFLNKAANVWRIFFFTIVALALEAFKLVVEPFSHLPGRLGGWARKAKESVQGELGQMAGFIADQIRILRGVGEGGPVAGQTGADVPRLKKPIISGDTADKVTPEEPGLAKKQIDARRGRIRAAQEAFRQLLRDRAAFAVEQSGATTGLADDLAALRAYNALLAKQMEEGHKTLALERERFGVEQQIADVVARQAEQAREAAKKRAEAARARRDARQFRLLGFGPTGGDIVPGVRNLRRQLASVADAIEGGFLDTNKTRTRLRNIRRVLAEGVGHISADVRAKIADIIADLKAQLKTSSVDVTKFHASAGHQFTGAGATPGGLVVHEGIHLHGVQDIKGLENALAKRRKQRAHARGGTR